MSDENSVFGAAMPCEQTYLLVWSWTQQSDEVEQLLEQATVPVGADNFSYLCSIVDSDTGGIFRVYRLVCTSEQRTFISLLLAGHPKIRLATYNDLLKINTYYAKVDASQSKNRRL